MNAGHSVKVDLKKALETLDAQNGPCLQALIEKLRASKFISKIQKDPIITAIQSELTNRGNKNSTIS